MVFREVEKKIVADGWRLVRIHGAHHVYRKVGWDEPVILSKHSGRDFSRGLLRKLEKETGLSLTR